MKSVIIGIHGLRNKPPKYILTNWWQKSIREGFARHNIPLNKFNFTMAYWAQCIHEKSQNLTITNPHHPQYLAEPYEIALSSPVRNQKSFRKKLSISIHEEILKKISGTSKLMNIGNISNIILHRMFIELDIYYHQELKNTDGFLQPARDLIRNELTQLLEKHRGKRICLLAHSMGSIIAYDVMTHVVPDIPIHTFITFGSPMGFPVIQKQFKRELHLDNTEILPTPPSLTRYWINYADPSDETCLHYNLSTSYAHNAHNVRPSDRMVINYYAHNNTPNPHKSYGYLRTGDMARELYRFLELEDAGILKRLQWLFKPPVL